MKPLKYFLICAPLVLLFVFRSASVVAEPVTAASSGQSSATAPDFPRFDIRHFDVSGNTLLDPDAVEQLLNSYTGKEKDFGDIQKALEALQQAYLAAGYGVVQVRLPEQDVERGTVQFVVIEGKIKNITVAGNEFHDEANILASVPMLKVGESPQARKIELNLKAANDNPSKKTQVLLKSAATPGEVDATLKVKDEKSWKVGATLDNTGSPETGNYRLGAFYQNSNIANRDHVLTAQYTTSPEKTGSVKVLGAGYRIPLYNLGDSVELFAGTSDVNSGTVQGLFNVSGKGDILGARYNRNLDRLDDYDHKLVFGIDQRAYRNNVQLGGAGVSLVPDITVRPLSVSYIGEWHVRNQQASLYVTEITNLSGGSKGSAADFTATRTNASANYWITRLGAEYSRAFDNEWQAHFALHGQYTSYALVPGEQFGIGGASSVRGFYERELANDTGYRGSVELYTPDFGESLGENAQMRALAFYDLGDLSRNKALAGEVTHNSIGSIGVGLRANAAKRFALQADLAQVLDEGGRQAKNKTRLHFGMVVTY